MTQRYYKIDPVVTKPSTSKWSKLSTGAKSGIIIGSTIGGLLVIAAIIFLIYYLLPAKTAKDEPESIPETLIHGFQEWLEQSITGDTIVTTIAHCSGNSADKLCTKNLIVGSSDDVTKPYTIPEPSTTNMNAAPMRCYCDTLAGASSGLECKLCTNQNAKLAFVDKDKCGKDSVLYKNGQCLWTITKSGKDAFTIHNNYYPNNPKAWWMPKTTPSKYLQPVYLEYSPWTAPSDECKFQNARDLQGASKYKINSNVLSGTPTITYGCDGADGDGPCKQCTQYNNTSNLVLNNMSSCAIISRAVSIAPSPGQPGGGPASGAGPPSKSQNEHSKKTAKPAAAKPAAAKPVAAKPAAAKPGGVDLFIPTENFTPDPGTGAPGSDTSGATMYVSGEEVGNGQCTWNIKRNRQAVTDNIEAKDEYFIINNYSTVYHQTITIEDAYRQEIGGSPFHMDIAKLVKGEFSIMQMVDNSLRHSSIVSAKQNPTNSKQIILTVAIPGRLQLIQIKQPIYIYNKINPAGKQLADGNTTICGTHTGGSLLNSTVEMSAPVTNASSCTISNPDYVTWVRGGKVGTPPSETIDSACTLYRAVGSDKVLCVGNSATAIKAIHWTGIGEKPKLNKDYYNFKIIQASLPVAFRPHYLTVGDSDGDQVTSIGSREVGDPMNNADLWLFESITPFPMKAKT